MSGTGRALRTDRGESRASRPARRSADAFTAFGLRAEAEPIRKGLHVVATPIGNLGDISFRALATLAAADAVIAEDTRVTKTLLAHYGIATPLVAYHEHNAAVMRPHLLARLASGAALALVSDAGTPLVSDPGFKLVADALAAEHRGDFGAGRLGRAGRAGRRGPADGPFLFRRLSAAENRPAAPAHRRTRRHSRHAGVFRIAAPRRGDGSPISPRCSGRARRRWRAN